MWPNPKFPADLVTFTEEIVNEKLHFLCSGICSFFILLFFPTKQKLLNIFRLARFPLFFFFLGDSPVFYGYEDHKKSLVRFFKFLSPDPDVFWFCSGYVWIPIALCRRKMEMKLIHIKQVRTTTESALCD